MTELFKSQLYINDDSDVQPPKMSFRPKGEILSD